MPLSSTARQHVEIAIADPDYGKEVADAIDGSIKKGTVIVPVAVTATTGTLPTPNGATVIANTATPTVVELLDLCMELKAKQDLMATAIQAN
jgi:hypothetical protein